MGLRNIEGHYMRADDLKADLMPGLRWPGSHSPSEKEQTWWNGGNNHLFQPWSGRCLLSCSWSQSSGFSMSQKHVWIKNLSNRDMDANMVATWLHWVRYDSDPASGLRGHQRASARGTEYRELCAHNDCGIGLQWRNSREGFAWGEGLTLGRGRVLWPWQALRPGFLLAVSCPSSPLLRPSRCSLLPDIDPHATPVH